MGGRQVSAIDRLPDDVRERLQALLRDPRVTQLEATARINDILDAEGRPERVSKSSVNRYALKMEAVGRRLRESREVAEMWVGRLGAAPQGKLGHLVNEIIRSLSFDMTLMLERDGLDPESAPETVKMLKDLALVMQRLEKAASDNVKREQEIRAKALEEAAATVGETARDAGVRAETITRIRRDVLRMSE